MSKLFCVPILNAMAHNKDTKVILEPYRKQRKQSKFIREAIIDFALKQGYNPVKLGKSCPFHLREIVPLKVWKKTRAAHLKGYLDYNFVIAFYWLLSLPEFTKRNKSRLMREIIITQAR